MEAILQLVLTFGAGVIGVAVGYGALRVRVNIHTEEIEKLWKKYDTINGANGNEPIFTRRSLCDQRVALMQETILAVSNKVAEQGYALRGVHNFARHWLQKEGLKIHEINEILNGKGP